MIVRESPPPPQVTVTEQQFVPYENDSFARAHAQAVEHLARRYPGSIEFVEAEKGLIEQFLKAQKKS